MTFGRHNANQFHALTHNIITKWPLKTRLTRTRPDLTQSYETLQNKKGQEIVTLTNHILREWYGPSSLHQFETWTLVCDIFYVVYMFPKTSKFLIRLKEVWKNLLSFHKVVLAYRAQLFEGRLALNPGLTLTRVSFSSVQKHFLR